MGATRENLHTIQAVGLKKIVEEQKESGNQLIKVYSDCVSEHLSNNQNENQLIEDHQRGGLEL